MYWGRSPIPRHTTGFAAAGESSMTHWSLALTDGDGPFALPSHQSNLPWCWDLCLGGRLAAQLALPEPVSKTWVLADR